MALLKSIEQLPRRILQPKIPIGALALGAFYSIYAQERQATIVLAQSTEKKPRVISRESDTGGHAIYVRLGFGQNIDKIAASLDPLLAPFGPRHYIKSASNPEANKEVQLKIAEKEQRPIIDILISKGGKDRIGEYADPEFMVELGPIAMAIFDSTPFVKDHIRRRGRAGLGFMGLLPKTHFVSNVLSHCSPADSHNIEPHSLLNSAKDKPAQCDRRTVEDCFYALQEVELLKRPPIMGKPLIQGMGESKIGKIIYFTSPYDPWVDTGTAFQWLVDSSGRPDVELVNGLKPGTHAGLTNEPRRLVEEITNHSSTTLANSY